MTTPLVVIGAGGFGREVLDVVAAINAERSDNIYEIIGVVDDAPSEKNLARLRARGIPHIGSESQWLALAPSAHYVIGIGSPTARQAIAERLTRERLREATLVHPAAGIGSASVIGAGSVVCAGAQISTNVILGRHVHINPNATVGHDSILEDFVSVNPAAVVSGDVTVQNRTLIGAGAVILQGISIGSQSVVGAAACVVRNVPDSTTVKGIPAR